MRPPARAPNDGRFDMGDDNKRCWNAAGTGACVGPFWFAAWHFTIAFLKLTFWKAVFAIVIWPYYIGAFFRK
jgi:hypothetical protein